MPQVRPQGSSAFLPDIQGHYLHFGPGLSPFLECDGLGCGC